MREGIVLDLPVRQWLNDIKIYTFYIFKQKVWGPLLYAIYLFKFQGEPVTEQKVPVLVRSEDSVGYAISRLVEALKMKFGEIGVK